MERPEVLYLVTEPWYFANHRLDHAKALITAGFGVHVATRRGDRWDELIQAGCIVHEVELERGSGSVRSWFAEMRAVRRIIRDVRPDVLHAVALKPVALALSLIVMRGRPALILSINGLGISAARPGRAMVAIRTVIRRAARMPRVQLLFQTVADQQAMLGGSGSGVVIPGVGVDVDRFVPGERSDPPPVDIAYLGRAVASKGLLDLADAYTEGAVPGVVLHLYLVIDPMSPGALDDGAVERLRSTEGIEVHESTRRPEGVLGTAHASILASRAGEGVSKFVLESLACGAPVLLSAESGSGEVVDHGTTGLLFPAGDVTSIRATLAEIAGWSPEQWQRARSACRDAVERNYSLDVIAPQIVELHRAALGARS